MPYHSPHKFRHGHAVYALKRAKDVSAPKAISQNLMHQNLTITDGVYGILSDADVRNQIAALGGETGPEGDKEAEEFRTLANRLIRSLQEVVDR